MAIRITQAGVALAVGIIIVTGLIIGGFFWVKNAGTQARREDAIKIAEQNLEKQSNKDVALNDGEASGSEASKNEASKNEASNGTASNSETSKNEASKSQSPATNNTSANTTTELPQTGPADQLATILIAGLLTFTAASYLASRQQLDLSSHLR